MGQCYNSIVVKAPVDKVWDTVKNFHDLSWASNVVEKVDAIGDKPGNKAGARRKLNDAFLETLTTYDEAERTFSYTIDEGPGPLERDKLERYVGTVKLLPVTATGETFVLWTSEYKAKEDSAVSDFCNPIYAALLKELAARFN